MGIFDKLLVGLGFEDNSSTPKPKKEKKTKEKKVKAPQNEYGVTFSLNNKQNYNNQEEEIVAQQTQEDFASRAEKSGFKIEIPKSQQEIQSIIDEICLGKTVIVNVSGFNATDRVRALDFLAGALYTLRGKIQPLEGNLYILYPHEEQ